MNRNEQTPVLAEDERLDEVNEGIRLIQKKQGLTFGTDAYLLAAFVRPKPRARAVDLGSGTGIIPLLLCATEKVASVCAVEVQPAFADLIERNAALNGLSHRIRVIGRDLRSVSCEQIGGEAELVVSNPPYLKTNAGKSNAATEKEIARHEVCGNIYDFCAAASRLLRTKGRFACVYRAERLVDLLDAMRKNRLEPKRMVAVHADADAEPCMVLVEAVKDASPALKLLPPLILYERNLRENGSRVLTAEAASIYATCSFQTETKIEKFNKKENHHEKS